MERVGALVGRVGRLADAARSQYPEHFGGVVYWDAATAVGNGGFHKAVKAAIRTNSSSTSPTSSVSAPSQSSPSATSPVISQPQHKPGEKPSVTTQRLF